MKPLEDKTYQLTEKDALSIYAKMMHTLIHLSLNRFYLKISHTLHRKS